MKKNLLLLSIFLITNTLLAQFNDLAPWMKDLNESSRNSNRPLKFQEIVDAFNTYWETRDPNKKGSGYKPFKRWETHWKNYVKPDGTLPSGQELLEQFNSYKASVVIQKNKLTNNVLADASNWVPVGPFSHVNTGSWSSGQGRVNAVVNDPVNPNTYYAGAPAGGFWKSTDNGTTWVTTTDQLPQIGVSGIAIDASNTNIIYVATGDDDAGDSFSIGVMKSTDGGNTWNPTGLNPTNFPSVNSMNDIYINPLNTNMVWVATNRGVFRTLDAGISWTSTLSNVNIKDIKVKPNDPNTIYAASSNRFYKSTNAGQTFNAIFSGLPASNVGRYVIDVTPANPEYVYLLSADSSYGFEGIYRSTNAGSNFTVVSNLAISGDIFESSQAWFDLAFAVSDSNPNELYVGVLNIWKGTVQANNQAIFTRLNSWSAPFSSAYTHADIHYLRFFNGQLLAGTDGGFYKSTNGGSSFTDLTAGMQISQFYRVSVSQQSSLKMVGGLQDNGGHAFNNSTWQNYYGADGMDTAVDPGNSNMYYGFIQNGGGLYISNNSGASLTSNVGSPNGTSGNWITPLKMSSNRELYAGYESLYKLNNTGTAWTQLSPNFGGRVDCLEIDDINTNQIYVAIDRTLRKSTNGGFNFTTVETFTTDITSIEVNNTNNSIVYVTTAGTNGGVFKSINGGLTFTAINAGLPSIPKNIIKHQALHSKNPLFLGTSLGVYRYDDDTLTWELFENGLPNVSVTDLEINIFDHTITASTYGRGIWQSIVPKEIPTQDIMLVSISGISSQIVCGNSISPLVEVNNNGANPINSVDLTYFIDGVPNVFSWSATTINSGQSQIIQLPNISISKGYHTFKVSASIVNDAYSINNDSEEQNVLINDAGVVNIMNTFENTSNELLVVNEGNPIQFWERGIPTGLILNNSVNPSNTVYGTNLDGNYASNTKSYLVSQCFDLTTINSPILKFDMAFDLETDWDIMYAEYSLNNGESWSLLGNSTDANWYNSNTAAGENNTCYNCVGNQWTGTNTMLTEYSKSLDAFGTATNFMVRLVFQSDQSINQEGVIIDNFIITGNTLSSEEFITNNFTVYPNPSNGIFTIKTQKPIRLDYAVYDVTGKLITKETQVYISSNNHSINMSNYAKGIYFLNITSDNSTITKKLMLK